MNVEYDGTFKVLKEAREMYLLLIGSRDDTRFVSTVLFSGNGDS